MALDNNIDELQIEIGTESQSATSGLEKLTETLNKLDRIANGSNGLNKVRHPCPALPVASGRPFGSWVPGLRSPTIMWRP